MGSILLAGGLVAAASFQTMRSWTAQHFGKTPVAPFSFVYDSRSSNQLLSHWKLALDNRIIDANRVRRTLTWTDPATKLTVRCVAVEYKDFPAIEWTVYFKNGGKKDTPILENIQALDDTVERPRTGEFLLHHNVGSLASANDYAPIETVLPPNSRKQIGAAGGRPTNTDLSYFNLAWGNQGRIVVVGWPGQWNSEFARDAARGVRMKAGQELTHLTLHPGEEVRTPLIVLMDWQGDWIDGQNQWRSWMMSYGMPKPGGRLPQPMFVASSSRAYGEMIGANQDNQIIHIDRYFEEGLKLDYWWMDAGWYVQDNGWPQVGTWEVDPKRFPKGLKPISDHVHSKGAKIIVWFEPERVAPDTWLAKTHSEWLLSPVVGLQRRRALELGSMEPCVVFNANGHPLESNNIHWDAKSIGMHPGPRGEYCVVRWTCPSSGDYRVEGRFLGIDPKTTTDVHVLASARPIYDGVINLNGHGKDAPFSQSVHLNLGETLDFVVGYGNGHYEYDSTGLFAKIVDAGGRVRDAAAGYASGDPAWSYGYLPPAGNPDASAFLAFGRSENASANSMQLLDLGNPQAWHWLVEHIDGLITENGIDLYRQDFNIDPLAAWRANDAPDRQGITENRYVSGYLAYWDELRRRHPNMLIDSCASGGRRNDLETMRRAVPLWRSDYAYEAIGHQGMTYGISMWLPFHGTGTVATMNAPYYGGGVTPVEPYAFWSNTAPSLGCGVDVRERSIDYDTLRRLVGEWRQVSAEYYGDFYPLTPYSLADDAWIAWQYNRSEAGEGVVQAFRRPKAGADSLLLKLRGLSPQTRYRIVAVEGEVGAQEATGSVLMEQGLLVKLGSRPGAAVVTYKRLAP